MSVYVRHCWCRPFGPRHVWEPGGACPPTPVEPLVEVGLGRRDASETTPDSPGDTIPGTETEGSRR